MPFVLISHHPDDHKLPRDIVPKLAALMPQAVCDAFDMCAQVQQPENVRVDTKHFSPYAKNQPLVSVHVSIKDKENRGKLFAEAVASSIAYSIGEAVKKCDPEFDPTKYHVTVDLVTRKFEMAAVPEPQ